MKTTALIAAVGFLAAFSVAGCTPGAREDVGQAGENIGQATEKSVEGTGEAVQKAGAEVAEETQQAGQAVERGVEKTGEALEEGGRRAGEAVGGAVRGAAQGTQDAAAAAVLTPRIKNALVASKQIDASTINVETSGEENTVILKGTVRSANEKRIAEQVARKALTDSKSTFKLRNDLTVAGAAR